MVSFSLGGDPASIRASASLWGSFSQSAGSASLDIKGLDASEFSGDEGETFRGKVNDDLPPHLDKTSEAWAVVSAALNVYAGKLESFQSKLSSLKTQHDNQQSKVTAAQSTLSSAKSADSTESQRVATAKLQLKPGESLPPSTYVSTTSGAQAHLNEVSGDLQSTIDAANQVWSDHRAAVTACCNEISRAKGMRFEKPPGFWGRLKNSVVDWVKDHADILKQISGVLKVISAIAGVLSLIPVLAPIMGPIALATGGAALLIDVTLKLATGEGSWLGIGIDAVTMVLPGVGKVLGKGLKTAVGAERLTAAGAKVTKVKNVVSGSKVVTVVRNSPVVTKVVSGVSRANKAVENVALKVPGVRAANVRAGRLPVHTPGSPKDFAQRAVDRGGQSVIDRARSNPLTKHRPHVNVKTQAQVSAKTPRATNGEDFVCPTSGQQVPCLRDSSGVPVRRNPDTGRLTNDGSGVTMPDTSKMQIGHADDHEWSFTTVQATEEQWTKTAIRDHQNNPDIYVGYEENAANMSKNGQAKLDQLLTNSGGSGGSMYGSATPAPQTMLLPWT